MSGIPTIPAGAQLGGAGTAENQAAAQAPVAPSIPVAPQIPTAPQAPQVPVQAPAQAPVGAPPVPVWNGTAWELPTTTQAPTPPSTPLVPVPQAPTAVPTAENPAVVEKPDESKPQPSVGETYIETSVNHFASEVGLNPETIADCIDKAIEYGDPSLINLSALGNLTPEQTQRANQLTQMVYQHTQAQITQNQNTVYAVAGGQEQWASAIGAFNASANEEAKGYVAYLVDNVGDAKAAAEYVIKYVKQSGLNTQITQAPIQGGTGAPVAVGLTVQEYKNGIHEIEMLRNSRSITQSEYDVRMADLDYRRGIGRQQGR